MKTSKVAAKSIRPNVKTAEMLQSVLDSTYALYLVTHNYHFNVEGSNFYSVHKILEDQYNELFVAIDIIGERIRALDAYVAITDEGKISKISSQCASTMSKSGTARFDQMLSDLIDLNKKAIDACQSAKDETEKNDDKETEDILIGRVTAHQKAIWMLKSIAA